MSLGAQGRIPGASALASPCPNASRPLTLSPPQVLSTLLASLSDDSFEFDSLLVYTCANNCAIPPRGERGQTGWACEVAFKQDFAAEGVKFGQR